MASVATDPDKAVLAGGTPDEYEFDHLFEPTTVGDVDIRNGPMMTGHTTNCASGEEITRKPIDYYVELMLLGMDGSPASDRCSRSSSSS